ncbi:MAG: hypothetical protein ACO1TE_25030 [Prosthecobacter sp.]
MKTKTVRFSQVVTKCGRPVVHDQWVALEKDAPLKKAVKENRVMTVHSHTVGAQKDHGEVGLAKRKGQQVLLIFLRSLGAFAEKRVVGINYDLLKETTAKAAKKPKQAKARKPSTESRHKSADSEAVLRLFRPDDDEAEAGPKKRAKSRTPRAATRKPKTEASEVGALRAQMRKALKQLQSGKAVMAYQTLEKALK